MSNVEQINKPKPPMVVLRDQFELRISELKTALPPHMSADRFIRVVMTAVQINQDLIACDRQTLWTASLRCAQDGLLPDGREAALVPFKNKVQYLPMYGGLLKKFRNSGQFKWIAAGIVYEGEVYEHYIDETGEHFKHIPGDETEGKKIRRVYALATTKDGGSFIADLPLNDINKRRNMSRTTREDAPWKQWPDEMMKKTAIRVLSKLLPMSSDIDALIRRDEEALLGIEAVDDVRAEIAARPTTQSALDHFAGDNPPQQVDDPAQETVSEVSESEHDSASNQEQTGTAETVKNEQPKDHSNPKTIAEYKDYAREQIVKATDIDALRTWFVSDQQRKLRNSCGLITQETDELRALIEQRAKLLAKGKS
jgi:recombination protein RecT